MIKISHTQHLKVSHKYLKRIQIKRDVESNDFGVLNKYKMVIVIPVYGEYDYIGKTLYSLSLNNAHHLNITQILLVINNPSKREDERYVKENQVLLNDLRKNIFQQKHCLQNLNLFWIDASSCELELPGEGGVGMARKLGMDSALTYLNWNNDPIIISLDADTLVENNYLEAITCFFDKYKEISGASINFKHLPGAIPEEERAIREYEFSIRYYVDKLKWAGSPYAYHAIGSALACRAETYIRAGGMKLNRGGEDFYFMQALRKLDNILEITDTTVFQSARPSNRVPFGTGPRVQQHINGIELKLYNPKIFEVLKSTLIKANCWIKSGDVVAPKQFADSLLPEAREYLLLLKFDLIWPNILKNSVKDENNLSESDKEQLITAFHVWFDAFRTLKFVHYLGKIYPNKYQKIPIKVKH